MEQIGDGDLAAGVGRIGPLRYGSGRQRVESAVAGEHPDRGGGEALRDGPRRGCGVRIVERVIALVHEPSALDDEQRTDPGGAVVRSEGGGDCGIDGGDGYAVGQLTRQPVLGREGHAVRLWGERWVERRIARTRRDEGGRCGRRRPAGGRGARGRSGRGGADGPCADGAVLDGWAFDGAVPDVGVLDAGASAAVSRSAPAVVVPAPVSVAVPLDVHAASTSPALTTAMRPRRRMRSSVRASAANGPAATAHRRPPVRPPPTGPSVRPPSAPRPRSRPAHRSTAPVGPPAGPPTVRPVRSCQRSCFVSAPLIRVSDPAPQHRSADMDHLC